MWAVEMEPRMKRLSNWKCHFFCQANSCVSRTWDFCKRLGKNSNSVIVCSRKMRHYALSILKTLTQKEQTLRQSVIHASTMASQRIAVCQMMSIADKTANMNVVSDLVSQAAKENVQMIFFPEACDYLCDNKDDIVKLAEPILGGETVKKYRQLAAEHKVWLSMGGIHEKDEKCPDKMFNTHVIIDDKGEIVQAYRKLHLFDVDIPEKNVRLKESDFSHKGAHIVTPVETPVGKVGLSICYDLRFPELSTSLALMGADILTFPSAFTHTTGEAHWHVLLRARAIENQCYVVAAAQCGQHNPKRRSFGHALCVDPWGGQLIDCGLQTPSYKVAEIQRDKLQSVRRNMPVFQHRRPDAYSLYTLALRKDKLSEHTEAPPPAPGPAPSTTPPEVGGASYTFGHVRVPATCVFYKTDLIYAFVNLRCVIPGHVLVAPRRLAVRNKDLTNEEASEFYKTIRLVQKLMEKVHNTDSCTVTIQDGPDAGQTVKHLHCHVMPRKKGDFIDNDLIYLELSKHDNFKNDCSPSKPARSLKEMEEEAEFLRKEIEKLAQLET